MHVNEVFEQNFDQQKIHPEKYMTTPAPFSIFLWTGYAEEGDSLYAGVYSVFDNDIRINLDAFQQNEELLDPYRGQLPVERLIWFSQGYYTVDKDSAGLLFRDIRFGRSDLWLTDEPAPFVWNYELHFNEDSTRVTGFKQFEPSFDTRGRMVEKLIDRIFGEQGQ